MYALFHVFILHKFEDNVGFRRVRVEAGVSGLIVAFIEDYRVLSFGYFQIGIGFGQTQCPCRSSFGGAVFCQSVGVDRDKEIGFCVIGAGKDILTAHPTYQGSLGTAISEAIELAQMTPNCKYTLGSVLSHVTLHQTIIGLEAEKQMEMAGEYPDVVIGCFGGGSNFGGISFPFMRHNILEGKKTRFVAAEPASCPKLTRGKFQYDFGDEAGYTPLLPMFTLGHNFAPAHIHAGGLRYHGAGVIVSQLLKDNLMEAVDIQQLESFEAGCLFAQAEGIIPAPESSHAIAAAIREAKACKETGEEKVILFNLSGHGLIDMASYDKYLAGDLVNYALTDEDIQKNLDEIGDLSK